MKFDKLLFGLEKSTVACFIYLPPDNSPFYKGRDSTGIGLLENLILKFNSLNEDVNILILGDLNARTANRSDYICETKIVPALEEYEYFLNDDVMKRTSCDMHVNKYGLELLEFCKAYMMRICNGRKGLDRDIGDFTYIGTNGSSVIDYVLCSDTMLTFIDNFKIEHRTESSHFPVSMSVQCMFRLSDHTAKRKLNYDRQFYKFDSVTTTKYKENLNHLLTNEFIHNFILTIQDYSLSISTVVEQFLDIFYKCGSCCIKICKGSVRLQPRWFDITCKRLKHEKY